MAVSKNLDHDLWAREAKAHWQKYRPKMYAELEKSGQLEPTLRNAVQRAQDQWGSNMDAGMDPYEAPSRALYNRALTLRADGFGVTLSLGWEVEMKISGRMYVARIPICES